MIDHVFNLCVDVLIWLAGIFGASYEAVNVVFFLHSLACPHTLDGVCHLASEKDHQTTQT